MYQFSTDTLIREQNFSLQTSKKQPQLSKILFNTINPVQAQKYIDLDSFRKNIEQSKAGLHHQPYTNNKTPVLIYKGLFFSFALLFLILGILSMYLPMTMSVSFFFNSFTLLKSVIIVSCTLLSLFSFIYALTLQIEKETIRDCVRKAKINHKVIYARKQFRLGLHPIFSFMGTKKSQATALRHAYHEGLEKINDKKDETYHLAQRIVTAKLLSPIEKEALLNQAIEELNEKLRLLTHSFRHTRI